MTMDRPVVCLGILVADLVARPVRTMPAAGRLVLVDEMGLYTGGCATNTATALARLGLPVEVIGKVGPSTCSVFWESNPMAGWPSFTDACPRCFTLTSWLAPALPVWTHEARPVSKVPFVRRSFWGGRAHSHERSTVLDKYPSETPP